MHYVRSRELPRLPCTDGRSLFRVPGGSYSRHEVRSHGGATTGRRHRDSRTPFRSCAPTLSTHLTGTVSAHTSRLEPRPASNAPRPSGPSAGQPFRRPPPDQSSLPPPTSSTPHVLLPPNPVSAHRGIPIHPRPLIVGVVGCDAVADQAVPPARDATTESKCAVSGYRSSW